MALNREKAGLLVAAVWLVLAVPISEDLYDEALDRGLFMRIFALVLVGLPVWLVFGWRWLTEKRPINTMFWISVVFTGLALAFLMQGGGGPELAIAILHSNYFCSAVSCPNLGL